jgi:hypothetical protein
MLMVSGATAAVLAIVAFGQFVMGDGSALVGALCLAATAASAAGIFFVLRSGAAPWAMALAGNAALLLALLSSAWFARSTLGQPAGAAAVLLAALAPAYCLWYLLAFMPKTETRK